MKTKTWDPAEGAVTRKRSLRCERAKSVTAHRKLEKR